MIDSVSMHMARRVGAIEVEQVSNPHPFSPTSGYHAFSGSILVASLLDLVLIYPLNDLEDQQSLYAAYSQL